MHLRSICHFNFHNILLACISGKVGPLCTVLLSVYLETCQPIFIKTVHNWQTQSKRKVGTSSIETRWIKWQLMTGEHFTAQIKWHCYNVPRWQLITFSHQYISSLNHTEWCCHIARVCSNNNVFFTNNNFTSHTAKLSYGFIFHNITAVLDNSEMLVYQGLARDAEALDRDPQLPRPRCWPYEQRQDWDQTMVHPRRDSVTSWDVTATLKHILYWLQQFNYFSAITSWCVNVTINHRLAMSNSIDISTPVFYLCALYVLLILDRRHKWLRPRWD